MVVMNLYTGFVLCGFFYHAYSVVVVDTPAASNSVHSSSTNCTNLANVPTKSLDGSAFSFPTNKHHNCSDVEVSIERIPVSELHWKNQVIIACMVTVAVEILIVALMVMCWRQIRWTLLKLTCPSWCCWHRRRRRAAQQQGSTSTNNVEDDSDGNDAGAIDASASVQLYVPVGQDSVDSSGDSTGQSAAHSSRGATAGPSYAPLRQVSQNFRDPAPWPAYSNSSDDSDVGEPFSSNFGRVSIPVISTPSVASDNFLMFNGADPYLCLERVEQPMSSEDDDSNEPEQMSATNLHGAGDIHPCGSTEQDGNFIPRHVK